MHESHNFIKNFFFNKHYSFLFLIYVFSHGLVLTLPNAIYWDDWTLYGVESAEIFDVYQQAGSMFNVAAYTHTFMLNLGSWSYKFFTFFLMFGAIIALDTILKNFKFLSVNGRISIVLMFMVLPLYWARVAMIDFLYTLSYFLFFAAWALMAKWRLLSLLLFFLSFNTNSTLVFYTLPIMFLYYTQYNSEKLVVFPTRFALRNLDFLSLPFIYFGIKTVFYAPQGLFENYNNVYRFGIVRFYDMAVYQANEFVRYFQTHFLGIIDLFFVLAATLFFAFIFFKIRFFDEPPNYKQSFVAILLGALALLCAVLPYWAVDHIPTFGEWTSRHQLLMPLGVSILFFSALILLKYKMRVFVFSLVLAVSLVTNIKTYKNFYFDWQKQMQLIELFRNSEDIRSSQIIVMDDNTYSDNAIDRVLRPYEWNGILATSFGDERRLGLNIEEYNNLISGTFYRGYFSNGEKFRVSDFDITAPNSVVNIEIFSMPPRTTKDKLLNFIGYKRYKIASTTKETILLDVYN